MTQVKLSLTVLFDGSFWIGLFEKCEEDQVSVAKVIFHTKPKDSELLDLISHDFDQIKFSTNEPNEITHQKKLSFKRMKRHAKKETLKEGIGTKSQQILKKQHELIKKERHNQSHQEREAQKKLKFDLKQIKRKEKHKGH